ncbi:MAG: prephenate dehydrogenase/arogenate dehydrogenase family protein [Candidatus Micrarchaeia archaeon]
MQSDERNTIGIVGGAGRMGLLFARYFRSKGYEVMISDIDSKKAEKEAKKNELKAVTNEELIQSCNIVLLSVPISKSEMVIKQLAPLARPESLLGDITSLKERTVKAMLKYAKPSVEVVGLHPLFGPTASIEGQNIVVILARCKKYIPWIKSAFKKSNLIFSTAKEHDRMMAIVQCLIHFTNIVTAMVMQKLKINPEKVKIFSTPICRERIESIERILSQNPELYADIEMENKNSRRVIAAFIRASRKMQGIINRRNKSAFLKLYKELAKYFKVQ